METPDEKNSAYPAGYEHVEQRVNETVRRVRDIDRQIETTPQSSKPVPEPHPPGYGGRRQFFNREKTIELLTTQKDSIQADAWAQIEKETPQADGKAAGTARDNAREALFPNPFRQMSKEEQITERGEVRDLEMSQNYMDAERLDKARERNLAPQPEKPTADKADKDALSASERYSRSLQYSKYVKQGRELVERAPDRTPDMDRD